MTTPQGIAAVPADAMQRIAEHLSLCDVLAARQVAPAWRDAWDSPGVCRGILKNHPWAWQRWTLAPDALDSPLHPDMLRRLPPRSDAELPADVREAQGLYEKASRSDKPGAALWMALGRDLELCRLLASAPQDTPPMVEQVVSRRSPPHGVLRPPSTITQRLNAEADIAGARRAVHEALGDLKLSLTAAGCADRLEDYAVSPVRRRSLPLAVPMSLTDLNAAMQSPPHPQSWWTRWLG